MCKAPPLETLRLSIALVSDEDAEFLVELLNDPDFIRFIGDRGVSTPEQARRYVRKARGGLPDGRTGLFVARRKSDRARTGICSLLKRENLPDYDIGFAFLPRYRRQGYALEATEAVRAYAARQLGIGRLLAVTHPDNRASIALLERLGWRFDSMIPFDPEGPESRLFVWEDERRT